MKYQKLELLTTLLKEYQKTYTEEGSKFSEEIELLIETVENSIK